MLVTCKICKNKIDKDTAYKIVVSGKNQYYCNEKEYLDMQEEKQAKAEVFNFCTDILGATTNTILFKEMSEISSMHSYKKISAYLKDSLSFIKNIMSKSFNSEYGKIKYFSTIIKNNIGDYIPEVKEERAIEVETTKINYKAKPRKKSLSQYLNEYEG